MADHTPSAGRALLSWLEPRTLRGQALGLLAFAVLLSAVLAYSVFNRRFVHTSEDALRRRGEAMTGILQQHQKLRLALALRDRETAGKVASEILSGDSDARYIIFLDSAGNVLGQALAPDLHDSDVPQILDEHLTRATARNADVLQFTRDVERDSTSSAYDLPDESGAPKSAALGKILMGLSARQLRTQSSYQTLGTIFFTALLLVAAFFLFFARVTGRLNRMAEFGAKVARGDLLASLPEDTGRDEISKLSASLRELTGRTGTMVGQLQDAAKALSLTSAEILSSSSQQGESATRQATSVAQTGATVTQMRETFNQASERAQMVIDLAKKSEDSTVSGRQAVQESVAAMGEIRDQVLTISKTILGLVERTNQIGTIIDAVNDLAEQSNVLALNAAIEAAKAGEHGRGFAVVAREVRSLAERSKDSTAQVRTILQDISSASREALGVTEEGRRKVQVGMDLASRAGQSIATLDSAINESSTAAKQIASSTRQQAVGVDQIWQAMREIDRSVSESATGIRKLEIASKNMKDLSDALMELVTQYRVARDKLGGGARS